MRDRPVVVLGDEGDPDVTELRFMAHMEAGDQIVFDGDMTAQPWWPTRRDRVHEILDDRRWGTV